MSFIFSLFNLFYSMRQINSIICGIGDSKIMHYYLILKKVVNFLVQNHLLSGTVSTKKEEYFKVYDHNEK